MNRGAIPGYYYDEEKKKYFKVQANHIAPLEAKYCKSNVKHERHESRKRKHDETHERLVQKQTVPLARLRRNQLLGGSGFQREHGDRNYATYDVQRNTAFVHGLESSEIELLLPCYNPRVVDAQYVPQTSQMLVAVAHSPGSHALYGLGAATPWHGRLSVAHIRPLHAFHDKIIHTAHWTNSYGDTFAFACASQGNLASGSACRASIGANDTQNVINVWNVAGGTSTIWDCKLSEIDGRFAYAGTHGISVSQEGGFHAAGLAPSAFGQHAEAFTCEWLNPSTIAFGSRDRVKKLTSHKVFLWDVRTARGVAPRFESRDRITGIHRPDESGQSLLVASTQAIKQYDTRIMRADRPVISLPHISADTNLHLTIYRGDLVAAVDQRQKLQVYSLRSGRHVRTLAPAKRHAGLLEKPRWQEDERGIPYLQACYGNTLQRWTWQGDRHDE